MYSRIFGFVQYYIASYSVIKRRIVLSDVQATHADANLSIHSSRECFVIEFYYMMRPLRDRREKIMLLIKLYMYFCNEKLASRK